MFSFLAAFVVVVVIIDVAVMIIIDVVLHSPDSSNGHLTLKTHFLLLLLTGFDPTTMRLKGDRCTILAESIQVSSLLS